MQKSPKPAIAKAKAKAKGVKAKAKPKAAADGSGAPPVDDGSSTYSRRKHKRKTADGHTKICASHCIETGKQMAQLTEAACEDAESVVSNLIVQLNDKSLTIADAVARLNEIKQS